MCRVRLRREGGTRRNSRWEEGNKISAVGPSAETRKLGLLARRRHGGRATAGLAATARISNATGQSRRGISTGIRRGRDPMRSLGRSSLRLEQRARLATLRRYKSHGDSIMVLPPPGRESPHRARHDGYDGGGSAPDSGVLNHVVNGGCTLALEAPRARRWGSASHGGAVAGSPASGHNRVERFSSVKPRR